MVKTAFIYTLNDPETGEIRYLGKLDSNPRKRLREHISESRTKEHYRACWIRSLAARGLKPTLELLDEVPFADWVFWEREYIRVFRAIGIRLVNGTDGGEGCGSGENHPSFGYKHTPEAIEKISAASTGKNNPMYGKPSPMLGKKASPETLALRTGEKNGFFGKKHTPETCAKISATKKLRKNEMRTQ